MERKTVDSSNIASIGYDAETATMHVEFHSGRVYEYADVPAEEHANLLAAPSVGGHFSKHIRPHYSGRQLNKLS